MSSHAQKLVAVVGATASGKTGLAIEIAQQFSGEVISADSRQIYRGLDIGTAKVTTEEMAGVPHHLIDIKDVDENYSAAEFKTDAEAIIADLGKRERLPIIAGGTFFYVDTLLGKAATANTEPNPELRLTLEEQSAEELYEQLTTVDPARAADIDPQNKRRLVRALEVVADQGAVPKLETGTMGDHYDVLTIGLTVDKEVLRQRFNDRLTAWLQDGFVDEVRGLLKAGISRDRLQEIGFEYSLMMAYIDETISEEELHERFVQKNWQYAKRQLTWLKRDNSIEWFQPQNKDAILHRVSQFAS